MKFDIQYEQEDDGRWLAEVMELPGVMAYGRLLEETMARGQALALRVLADRLEHGEGLPGRDSDEIGPRMLARIAKVTGLAPEGL